MIAPETHGAEEKLLELVYGELPDAEAERVEAHVKTCERCAGTLASLRGVRATMSVLPREEAPEAGLESLLAYAQQSARRTQAGPLPRARALRRWLWTFGSVASLAVVGVVAHLAGELTVNDSASALAGAEPREEQAARPLADFKDLDEASSSASRELQAQARGDAPEGMEFEPAPRALSKEEAERSSAERRRAPPQKLSRKNDEASGKKRLRVEKGRAASLKPAPSAPSVGSARGPAQVGYGQGGAAEGVFGAGAADPEPERTAVAKTKAALSQVAPAEPPAPAPPAAEEYAEAEGADTFADDSPDSRLSLNGGASAPAPRTESASRPTANRGPSAPATQAMEEQVDERGALELELRRVEALLPKAAGVERAALLMRGCRAAFSLGRRGDARRHCLGVTVEAPGTAEAAEAERLLRGL